VDKVVDKEVDKEAEVKAVLAEEWVEGGAVAVGAARVAVAEEHCCTTRFIFLATS
jgi:hypothetical protein